jgi:hypothetical protein
VPKISNGFISNASPAQSTIEDPSVSSAQAIENRQSKIERAGSRIRTDDLLITNATVIWAFVILTYVNSDFDNPSQPSKSAEIPWQWQYLAVTINACFARKNELFFILFCVPIALLTRTDNDLFCAERAQSRWSTAKASNTFTAHSER